MSAFRLDCGPQVEEAIAVIESEIAHTEGVTDRYPKRWLAVALLDEDGELADRVRSLPGGAPVVSEASRQLDLLRASLGGSADTAIAGSRFQWAHDVASEVEW